MVAPKLIWWGRLSSFIGISQPSNVMRFSSRDAAVVHERYILCCNLHQQLAVWAHLEIILKISWGNYDVWSVPSTSSLAVLSKLQGMKCIYWRIKTVEKWSECKKKQKTFQCHWMLGVGLEAFEGLLSRDVARLSFSWGKGSDCCPSFVCK